MSGLMRTALAALACIAAGCGGSAPPAESHVPKFDVTRLELDGMEPPVERLIEARRKAVSADPANARRWVDLGFALDAHRLTADAEACLAEAVALDPDGFDHLYQFAFLGALNGRAPEEVLARFEAALRLRDDYAALHLRRGESLLDFGRSEEALAAFERALELDPDYHRAELGAARAELDLGLVENATVRLRGLRENRPSSRIVAATWAQALVAGGAAQEAAAVNAELPGLDDGPLPLRDSIRARVLQLTSTSVRNRERAQDALLAGDLDRAATFQRLALEGAPGEARLALELASIEVRRRRSAAAFEALEPHLTDRARSDVLELAGQLDVELGRPQEGLDRLDRARRDRSLTLASMHARASALGQLERWSEAAGQFLEAAESAPEPAEFHAMAGLALIQAGRMDEAREALASAAEVAPDHPLVAQLRRQLER